MIIHDTLRVPSWDPASFFFSVYSSPLESRQPGTLLGDMTQTQTLAISVSPLGPMLTLLLSPSG